MTHTVGRDFLVQNISALASDLERIAGRPVTIDADLRQYSRWRAGGRARLLVQPVSRAAVAEVLRYLAQRDVPQMVIGDGSNILFDDAGFDGVIVCIGRDLSSMRVEGASVWAEAGLWVPHFVRAVGKRGLGGLEHAIGIPGTLGGLVMMNGGSRRQGVGSHIRMVRGCDQAGVPFERSGEDCKFRYRGSTLQDDRLVVLEAEFALTPVDMSALRHEMIGILADRRRKFPKSLPNCGSVFLSDPAMYKIVGPPGAAIEAVGLKGRRLGDAQISPLHANFIVNLGQARSADILGLIHLIRTTVHEKTGFWMDAEVRHVAPDGRVTAAHEAAAMLPGN